MSYTEQLPSGYDLRDYLNSTKNGDLPTVTTRLAKLSPLFKAVQPVPQEWLMESEESSNGEYLPCLTCEEYKTLISAWRKALKWTPGLDHALSMMLASIASVRLVGDQLWIKVISPASSGKSVLCEALSVNQKHVLAKSTIRGFHSGYKSDRDGSEDHSLINLLYDKTLVIKDGDTLLRLPNRDQVLSEARDLYDGVSRAHYRSGINRDYLNVRMTIILCGTNSLRRLDTSELGERFLDCIIMENIDDDLEDAILYRVANRVERDMSIESNGEVAGRYSPELRLAMQLTGGYVDYLKDNTTDLISRVHMPEESLRRCIRLGKFVAYMRARPSKDQEEASEREFAARLVSQLVRLAKCLSIVLNRSTVDEEVMHRVTKVALDTGRGQTLEIVRLMYKQQEAGSTILGVSNHLAIDESKAKNMLRFLRRIEVVYYVDVSKVETAKRIRWKLTKRVRELFEEVVLTDA